MSYFEFPHTRNYDGDLGWVIKKVSELAERYNNFFDINHIRFADPIDWDITKQYQAFTIVFDTDNQISFISKKAVPSGVDLSDIDYWEFLGPLTVDGPARAEIDRILKFVCNSYEANNIATAAHAVGDFIISGGEFYEVTTAINIGDTITSGVNVTGTTIENMINSLVPTVDLTLNTASNNPIANSAVATKFGNTDNAITNLNNNVGVINGNITQAQADITSLFGGYNDLSDALDDTNTDLATEISNRTNADITINARIDAIASLPSGSTSGDAELMDIRVAADGTTYPSAGDSVRAQCGNLNDALSAHNDPRVNLAANTTWTIDKAIKWQDGTLVSASGKMTSDFIRITPMLSYSTNVTNHVAFYDENKTYMGDDVLTNQQINVTAPAGAYFVRIDTEYKWRQTEDIVFIVGTFTFEEILTMNYYDRSVYAPTVNLFDRSKVVSGYYLHDTNGLTSNANFCTSGIIPVTAGTTYTGNFSNHLFFFDQDYALISYTNQVFTVTAPVGAKYARFDWNITERSEDKIMFVANSSLPGEYYPFITPINRNEVDNTWSGKTWSCYGDSIAAISNGNGLFLGWSEYVNAVLPFRWFHGRGIGAQTFAWGTAGGSACWVNSSGNYVGRDDDYNKDNYPGTVPTGTTLIRGAFCSWDRIVNMYPAAIKDTIDVVFVMGGTNDAVDNTDLAWVANDTTDPEWAASTYYSSYNGDYNISTLAGGVASTIMKLQAWMPNAVIILGTPLNGQTNIPGGRTPATIPDEYQKCPIIESVSKMFGCPLIDVFGTCGINVLNSPTYITDGTHPYNDDGKKMVGRCVLKGLTNVYQMI